MWEGIRWYKRTIKAKRQILQCDMNVNMLGGVFEMDAKYGMSLALIFLAHLYFGAIPLLCPIMSIYFFVQFWLDKLYITKFARKPPHYQKNLHNTMISIIPYSTFLHCAFSLWAYGNPEIWPSKVEARVENGITRYYPEDRSFSERIFNENSMPHFILLCTLVTIYILELFSENCILKLFRKCLFKKDKLGPNSAINMEQKTFTKMRTRMAKFSQTSYDPELNDAYAKILLAMKDVAIIKKDIDPEALPKADKDSKLKKVKTSEIAYKEYKKKKQMKKKIQDEKLKGKDMEFDPKEEKKGLETSRDDDSEDPLTKKPQRHRKLPKIEKNRKNKKNKNSNKPKKTPSKPKKNARR